MTKFEKAKVNSTWINRDTVFAITLCVSAMISNLNTLSAPSDVQSSPAWSQGKSAYSITVRIIEA